jgi:hypothetical protein
MLLFQLADMAHSNADQGTAGLISAAFAVGLSLLPWSLLLLLLMLHSNGITTSTNLNP